MEISHSLQELDELSPGSIIRVVNEGEENDGFEYKKTADNRWVDTTTEVIIKPDWLLKTFRPDRIPTFEILLKEAPTWAELRLQAVERRLEEALENLKKEERIAKINQDLIEEQERIIENLAEALHYLTKKQERQQ